MPNSLGYPHRQPSSVHTRMSKLKPKLSRLGEPITTGLLRNRYRLFPRSLPPAPAPKFEVYSYEKSQPNPNRIPRIIWSYWSGSPMPLAVKASFESWKRCNPDFEIHMLNEQTVHDYIPDAPDLSGHTTTKQTNWIRLELLRRYGGIWLDATFFVTRSLNWVIEQQERTQSDFVGFYLKEFTTKPEFPVVETWFLAAPPDSPMIRDWVAILTEEVIVRKDAEYMEYLKGKGLFDQVVQNIAFPHYLTGHLSFQVILQRNQNYRMTLQSATEGPLFYHKLADWKRKKLRNLLLFYKVTEPVPALVKIRKPDRKHWDLHLGNQVFVKDSFTAKYLVEPGQP